MNRLTKWNGKKYVLPQGRTSQGESYWQMIAARLAAYENTGYEPWEIEPKRDNRPRGYDIEIQFDGGVWKEMWFGTGIELSAHLDELREKCNQDGWDDAIIIATKWKKGEQ